MRIVKKPMSSLKAYHAILKAHRKGGNSTRKPKLKYNKNTK